MFGLSYWHLLLVVGIIVLLFPGRVTRTARSLGQTLHEVRQIGGREDER